MHTGAPHNIDETWAIYTGINPQCSPWGSANRRGAEFGTMQDCTTRCDAAAASMVHALLWLCYAVLPACQCMKVLAGKTQHLPSAGLALCPVFVERPAPRCKPQFQLLEVSQLHSPLVPLFNSWAVCCAMLCCCCALQQGECRHHSSTPQAVRGGCCRRRGCL